MKWLAIVLFVAGCPASPTSTGTVCPDPDPYTLTYQNFGKAFVVHYCTWCHDSHLPLSKRNGAPIDHDYDSLHHVLEVWYHTDKEAGIGPDAANRFMPGLRCPSVPGGPLNRDCDQPTDEERVNLAMWIACERNRPYNQTEDAGVGSAVDAQ